MQELIILSYIEYGDIEYILHVSCGGDVEGVIPEGDSKSYCVRDTSCNVIVRTTLGWSFYFVLDGEEVLDMGGFEKTQIFGVCETEDCSDMALLMSTNPRDGGLNVLLTLDNIVMFKEQLDAGDEAIICINTSKCNLLDGEGYVYYYFFRDGEVFDRGFTLFGPCETTCMGRPVLADSQRGQDIVTRLSTVSGMRELADFNSARYQAACWLVHDDLKKLEANDSKLIQRYILSVIYLTSDGPNWEAHLGFMGGKDECDWEAVDCNENNLVNYIYLGFNKCRGTLASETMSLVHLEFLDITRNYFTGTFPTGLSRLPMKYFDIFENKFSGSLPADVFQIDGLEYFSVGRNTFTGTIHDSRKDITQVTELWLQDNYFSGTIPQWFQEVTGLKMLFLHFNQFSGTLPAFNLPNLQKWLVWDNQLTGSLPSSVFACPSLREIYVTKNKMTGSIVVPDNYSRSLIRIWLNENNYSHC